MPWWGVVLIALGSAAVTGLTGAYLAAWYLSKAFRQ